MSIEADAAEGRAVGSHIRLRGRMLGIALDVECVVVNRTVPQFKEWQTIGTPRLLVIGPYRMSIRIEQHDEGSAVAISLDWSPPLKRWQRLLSRLFGRAYARWCIKQMVRDIEARFAASGQR